MKKLFLTLGLLSALLLSCKQVDEKKEGPKDNYLAILRDTSQSRAEVQYFDSAFLSKIGEMLIRHGVRWELDFVDITNPYPDVKKLNLEALPIIYGKLDARHGKSKDKYKATVENNEAQLAGFINNIPSFTSSSGEGETCYTYLENSIRIFLHNLNDTISFDRRILFIHSDFYNHEPQSEQRLISSRIIDQLNEAVENGLRIFLYTETNRMDTDLKRLDAVFLTHPNDFYRQLNLILFSEETAKLYEY